MAYVCALSQLSNCFTALHQSCSNQYFYITNSLTDYSDNPTENNYPTLQFPSALLSILASFSLLFWFFQLLPLINSLVSSKCKPSGWFEDSHSEASNLVLCLPPSCFIFGTRSDPTWMKGWSRGGDPDWI